MRHHVANAIDWYVNKMNEAHLLPVNLATLIRDISAKQIGGPGFRPRPIKVENFTDPELDSIISLVDKAKGGNVVDYQTYYKDLGLPQKVWGKKLNNYLSPLNTIRTTLGQFAVIGNGADKKGVDTYDFNREGKWNIFDHGDGTFSFRNWNWDGGVERQPKKILEAILSRRREGAYGLIRQNAANFGHTDDDPDSEKIKVNIPVSDIKKKLGENVGKHDIKAPVSDDEFKWRSIGAGAALGTPVGAFLGALSGGIRLLDKKARKHWIRTMLSHILTGAAIGAVTGGVGTGIAARSAIDKFNSNTMNEKTGSSLNDEKEPKRKKSNLKSNIIKVLAYSLPVAAMAGACTYGMTRLKDFRDKLLNPEQDIYSLKNHRINFVDSVNLL